MYLEPSRTSRVERFCENSQRLVAVNYFCKNAPSWMVNLVLNAPLEILPGNIKIVLRE